MFNHDYCIGPRSAASPWVSGTLSPIQLNDSCLAHFNFTLISQVGRQDSLLPKLSPAHKAYPSVERLKANRQIPLSPGLISDRKPPIIHIFLCPGKQALSLSMASSYLTTLRIQSSTTPHAFYCSQFYHTYYWYLAKNSSPGQTAHHGRKIGRKSELIFSEKLLIMIYLMRNMLGERMERRYI